MDKAIEAAMTAIDDLRKARKEEQRWEPANQVPDATPLEELQAAIAARSK